MTVGALHASPAEPAHTRKCSMQLWRRSARQKRQAPRRRRWRQDHGPERYDLFVAPPFLRGSHSAPDRSAPCRVAHVPLTPPPPSGSQGGARECHCEGARAPEAIPCMAPVWLQGRMAPPQADVMPGVTDQPATVPEPVTPPRSPRRRRSRGVSSRRHGVVGLSPQAKGRSRRGTARRAPTTLVMTGIAP